MTRKPEETKKEMRDRRERRRVEKQLATSNAEVQRLKRGSGKTKRNRLQDLYLWGNRPFVEQLLDTGASNKSIVDYCRGKGFTITAETIKRYKSKREAAVRFKGFADIHDFGPKAPDYDKMKNIDAKAKERLLEEHLERWEEETRILSDEDNVVKAGGKEFRETKSEQLNSVARKRRMLYEKDKKKERAMTDIQFLDVMIQKGMETLAQMPTVDPGKALKAIELKHKLTNGSHGGLTMYGMEEIRLRENARESAMTDVILNFVPESEREELLERLEYTTEKFYKAHGLGDVYKNKTASEIEEYLEKEGLEPEEDESYYEAPPENKTN